MSTTALKQAVTGNASQPKQPKDLAQILASPNVQQQIKAALPRHMTPERMARIATTEMRRIPKLAECNPMSFLGAVIQCSQLGLEPGGTLGHVYLIPYGKEVQVIVGYRGMIDLARRSGQIVSLDARAVYEGDKFDCSLGLDAKIHHEPDWNNENRADPKKLRFVYAVAKLKDGGVQFDIMSKVEVDAVRKRSKSASNGPWVTDYVPMALKTVIRRLFKYLPVSIEMQHAVGIDEQAENDINQQNSAILDGNFTEVDEPQQLAGESSDGGDTTSLFDRYRDRIEKSTEIDVLDIVMDDIREIEDEEQRNQLTELAKQRRAALKS